MCSARKGAQSAVAMKPARATRTQRPLRPNDAVMWVRSSSTKPHGPGPCTQHEPYRRRLLRRAWAPGKHAPGPVLRAKWPRAGTPPAHRSVGGHDAQDVVGKIFGQETGAVRQSIGRHFVKVVVFVSWTEARQRAGLMAVERGPAREDIALMRRASGLKPTP